eukprot:GGOE01004851.1.p1 GENE.GGOE01004851.1~~GGOE01004851.1.p1  ORF type:complete len:329 (+),score=62.40 GGOE01004851.1:28-987(+)
MASDSVSIISNFPLTSTPRIKGKRCETDEHRLAQRSKQIQFGENTAGYHNLLKAEKLHPELLKGCLPNTPSLTQKCSKRSWDGQVRRWRRALHLFDFIDANDREQVMRFAQELKIQRNKPEKEDTPPFDTNSLVEVNNLNEERIRYSFESLLQCADSSLVAPSILLPASLEWLDKRFDLEDELEAADREGGDSEEEDVSVMWNLFDPPRALELPMEVSSSSVVSSCSSVGQQDGGSDGQAQPAWPVDRFLTGCLHSGSPSSSCRAVEWGYPSIATPDWADILSAQPLPTQVEAQLAELNTQTFLAPLFELGMGFEPLCT